MDQLILLEHTPLLTVQEFGLAEIDPVTGPADVIDTDGHCTTLLSLSVTVADCDPALANEVEKVEPEPEDGLPPLADQVFPPAPPVAVKVMLTPVVAVVVLAVQEGGDAFDFFQPITNVNVPPSVKEPVEGVIVGLASYPFGAEPALIEY